jgi:NhaA family Na+:H+ antiporter
MPNNLDFIDDFFDMLTFKDQATRKARLSKITKPVQQFISTEISSGIIVITAVFFALLMANSPLSHFYHDFVHLKINFSFGNFSILGDVHYWINDAAMVIFFFLVGIEIKREVLGGELSDKKSIPIPIFGAIGGMVVPVLIFLLLVNEPNARSGWAIPMATDIAIALGAIALLGKLIPSGLKVMLLAIAIVDDIGSILVIAIFYSETIYVISLMVVAILLGLMFLSNYVGIRSLVFYFSLGILAWIFANNSGVHPTILGVILGFMTPWKPWYAPISFPKIADKLLQRFKSNLEDDTNNSHHQEYEQDLLTLSTMASETVSPLQRIEKILLPWSAFLIVPIFAFVNAGIDLSDGAFSQSINSSLTLAIAVGLFVGKPLGIVMGVWIATKFGARFPRGVNFSNIFGMGIIAGIGFTVALFITELAYVDEIFLRDAKIGILIASFFAAIFGNLVLKIVQSKKIK